MTLSERLSEYVEAAFTGLWVQSHEHPDALREIAQLCRDRGWALATWDVDRGLAALGHGAEPVAAAGGTGDPIAAIRAINALANPESSALLVLVNFHRFLQSAEIVQALAHQVQAGKDSRTFVLILSPVVQIPVELEKQFVLLEHDLPDHQQLRQIAAGTATQEGEMPADGEALQRLLDAVAGLTRFEAEGAFSLSLVRHGRLEPRTVWELKTQALKKFGCCHCTAAPSGSRTRAAWTRSRRSAPAPFSTAATGRPTSARAASCCWASPAAARARCARRSATRPAAPRWSSTSGRCSAVSWVRRSRTCVRRCASPRRWPLAS